MPCSHVLRLLVLSVATLSLLICSQVPKAFALSKIQEPLTNHAKLPPADAATQLLTLQHQLSARLEKHGKVMFKHRGALSQSLMMIGMSIDHFLLDFDHIRKFTSQLSQDTEEDEDLPLFLRKERRSQCMRDVGEMYHVVNTEDRDIRIRDLCAEVLEKLKRSVRQMEAEMHQMEQFMLHIGRQVDLLIEQIVDEVSGLTCWAP